MQSKIMTLFLLDNRQKKSGSYLLIKIKALVFTYALVAQLVEQLICNQKSSPI